MTAGLSSWGNTIRCANLYSIPIRFALRTIFSNKYRRILSFRSEEGGERSGESVCGIQHNLVNYTLSNNVASICVCAREREREREKERERERKRERHSVE